MRELRSLETSRLVDLLAEETAILTKMFTGKEFTEEYENRKMFLKAIQTEIDFRKTIADVIPTTITRPPDFT